MQNALLNPQLDEFQQSPPAEVFPAGRYRIVVEGEIEKTRANWKGGFLVTFRGPAGSLNTFLLTSGRLLGTFNVPQPFLMLWIMPSFPLEVDNIRLTNLDLDVVTVYRFAAKSTNKQLFQLRFNPAVRKT